MRPRAPGHAGPSENDTGGLDAVSRRAARGAASNYAGQLVAIATGFLLTPFVLHRVGETAFALWVLATALGSYGALLDLGISSTVQKFVAEHRARESQLEVSRFVTAALTLYALLACVVVVAASLLAVSVPRAADVEAGDHTAAWLIALVGVQVAFGFLGALPIAVLRGTQRFELSNGVYVAATLVAAAGTVVVLSLGYGIVAVAVVTACVAAGSVLPSWGLARRAVPGLNLDRTGVTVHRIREILGFGISVFAVRLAGVLTTRTDPFVIRTALPVRSVTPYALAQRLSETISLATSQLIQVLLPIASQFDAREERHALRALYLTSTRIVLAVSIGLGGTICVLAPSILHVWVGPRYEKYGTIAALLAVAAILDTIGWSGSAILTGLGRHRPLAWMALTSGATKVALSLVFVQWFGLVGVAVATLVPITLQLSLLVVPYSLSVLAVDARQFFREAISPNVVPPLTLLLVLAAARVMLDTDELIVLIASVGVALAVYVVVYLKLSAGTLERQLAAAVRRRTAVTVARFAARARSARP